MPATASSCTRPRRASRCAPTASTTRTGRSTSPRRAARFELGVFLYYGEDVALAVLEPRRLSAPAGEDAVLGLHVRHVVFLELHAALLQLGDFALDVLDLPERLAGLRGAGVLGRIEKARSALAELVDHAAGDLLLGLEADLVLIEPAGAADILGGNVGVHRRVL